MLDRLEAWIDFVAEAAELFEDILCGVVFPAIFAIAAVVGLISLIVSCF